MNPNNDRTRCVKQTLVDMLKEEKAFWSYDNDAINASDIPDDQLIAMTMRYLDLDQIKLLFEIFSFKKIKSAWQRLLIPEGEYLFTLNRFFAWYYFKAKNPDAYVRSLETRHLNRLLSTMQ